MGRSAGKGIWGDCTNEKAEGYGTGAGRGYAGEVAMGGVEGGGGWVGEELGHVDGLRCGGFRIPDGLMEKAGFTVFSTVRGTVATEGFYGGDGVIYGEGLPLRWVAVCRGARDFWVTWEE